MNVFKWNLLIFYLFYSTYSIGITNTQDVLTNNIVEEPVVQRTREEIASKSKVDSLGPILKQHIEDLRQVKHKKVDIVFLVDSSASVGQHDFIYEVKFVRKLLADFTVDSEHTRVTVITFSSRSRVLRQIDYIGQPLGDKNKCSLLAEDIPNIRYVGGGTYTKGAILEAKDVLRHSRRNSKKAIFLVTDGFSNGGDPKPEAEKLKESGVKLFTFGIRNGNVQELMAMASEPKNETCYILDSFNEFEALARRALHEDLKTLTYADQPLDRCRSLCENQSPCCDRQASCRCGTHTGDYECVCREGFYGTGLQRDCHKCPSGTYKGERKLGDIASCTKCPDENQTTEPGSTHVTQCKCKKGFRTINDTGCAVLRCSVLVRPKNGYFVNEHCDNVFNAACGIKCKPGYELRGSSLRICQENGEWSGLPTECIMKTCPALPRPKHGNMICDRDDFSFSTVCRFTCDTGYRLVGSRKRECLAIAFWTGITTRCREITCQPLPSVRDGNVKPAKCTSKEVSFGTICRVRCHSGYSLVGPDTKLCTPEGMWTPAADGEMSRCEDKSPPFLLCPSDILTIAPDDDDSVEVTWQIPLALDNSGLIPIMSVVPAVEPPKRFPIGLTYVKYIAEDLSGNRKKCRFQVVVKDTTPPQVDSCFSPEPVVSSSFYADVTWNEPLFSDNSGESPRIEKSHAPGLFPRGTTIVTYTAFDESGNNSTCKLEITVIPHPCQYPAEPLNGRRFCYEDIEGVYCNFTCNDGFAFAINPADVYFCAYNNIWTPVNKLPIPDCSVQTATNSMEFPASITYLSTIPCRQHILLTTMEETFHITLSKMVSGLCEENMICEVDDVETTCEEEEPDFNKIKIILSRKRREVARVVSRTGKPQTDLYSNNADSSITFDFVIKGETSTTGTIGEDLQRQKTLNGNLKSIMQSIKTKAFEGTLDFTIGDTKARYANMTFTQSGPTFKCKAGSVVVNTTCVHCPSGTYFNVVSKNCEGCPIGTFQPVDGSISCLVCPYNTSTEHNNSKSIEECKAMCLPGSFSWDGLERCTTCEIGFYQAEYGQTSCTRCPPQTTTKQRGSRGVGKCKERCKPGYVSLSGLAPCLHCPKGTYQPDAGQSVCFECPMKSMTTTTASTNITDCIGFREFTNDELQADQADDPGIVLVNDCFENKCQNGATCKAKPFGFVCECTPGYKGAHCETRIDHCEGVPCMNGGTCINSLTGYNCSCNTGFEGDKCEININECNSSPCLNNGTCIDGDNAFVCNCPDNYKGLLCNTTIDFCKNNPCLNNGVCQSSLGGYTCNCTLGFRGTNCEINHDECGEAPCQNGGTCEDGIGMFRCQCVLGYTGEFCQTEIDECASSPCTNGARCEDVVNGYVCHCNKGFSGSRCEIELDIGYMLDFPSSGTFNYTSATIDQDLTALTVSFWMKTDDIENQGTPFSYASSDKMDNAFTMTNYDGFVVYVNNQQLHTDVQANDGLWHHIVFTWSSNRGSWKIYKDGVAEDNGDNLAAGKTIHGGGTFVIGQEQDPNGTYSSTESFIGQITQLNIWDSELPFQKIDSIRTSCKKFIGNVIAWPDIQTGLRGALKPVPSGFCRDCPVPVDPHYGESNYTTTTVGSWATYSCKPGFNPVGRLQRQCLATGEWEGEPTYCIRVSCGFPGVVINGFIIGRKYDFDSKIQYRCQNNYQLKGNKYRYCLASGHWDGENPVCEEITCKLPMLSENTIASNPKRNYKTGERVSFSCTVGNRILTEHSSVLCQSDGTWDKSVPTCDPQTCTTTPSIPHAIFTETRSEYSVGYILSYTCDEFHKLPDWSPKGEIRCLPNGTWESTYPNCTVITCPQPPTVINAEVQITGLTVLEIASYTCIAGYYLDGEKDLDCTEDGTWSHTPPVCLPVDCSDPGNLNNGEVITDRFTFGSVASYICDAGYVIDGLPSRTCQANANWSGNTPVCNPISCGLPEQVENGLFEQNGNTYRSIATYSCQRGYKLSGTSDRVCQANGKWSGTPPGCHKLECNAPPVIHNGFYVSSGSFFEDIVNYTCNAGYFINGSRVVQCDYNGEWSPEPPHCQPIECPVISTISNGNFTATGFTFGSRVEYRCQQGYNLLGEALRTCQSDGSWSDYPPSCIPGECLPPLPILNGNSDYKDLSLGSVALYSCNVGYRLVGEDVRRCMPTLTWSDAEPRCLPKSCSEPRNIANGQTFATGLFFNSVVNYECDPGYRLTGDSQLTCGESGEWSPNVPSCEIVSCETPSHVVSNGRSIGNIFTFGSTIRYACDPGYNLVGSANRTCQSNGQWDTTIPVCEVVHCPRPQLRNGYSSGFQTEYMSVHSFGCRDGYVMFGAAERQCLENRTWSGEDPLCVKCRKAPLITNGVVRVQDKIAIYSCRSGYALQGNDTLHCEKDGSWKGIIPECLAEECDVRDLDADLFLHGSVSYQGLSFGDRANYTCNEGYKLIGESWRVCQADSLWSDVIPTCIIVRCPGSFRIQFGGMDGTNNEYNSSINFYCNSGYKLDGDSSITCLANGTWSGVAPTCERILCPQPDNIGNGQITVSDLTVGSEVFYLCNIGHKLVGSNLRTCQESGIWSGSEPTCQQKLCPEQQIENGQITDQGRLVGTPLMYMCDEGYELQGNPLRICTETETWTGFDPTCVAIRCPAPPEISNGVILDNDRTEFFFGDMIQYKCNVGYILSGISDHTCQLSKRWSGSIPSCVKVSCGTIPYAPNTKTTLVNGTSSYDSVVQYTCEKGYQSQKDAINMSKCLSSGYWSEISILCSKVSCNTLPNIQHGIVSGNNFEFGSSVSITCEKGYQLEGSVHLHCSENGSWSAINFPSCDTLISCPLPDTPSNAVVSYQALTYGEDVVYRCNDGYQLIGNARRTCTELGSFSDSAPFCRLVTCSKPDDVMNAYKTPVDKEFVVGDQVEYVCKKGYILSGNKTIRCDVTGFWQDILPYCDKVNCTRPLSLVNGNVQFSDLSYGSNVSFSCRNGYLLKGSNLATCLETGQWSSTIPVCEPVSCGTPISVANSYVVGDVYTYGYMVTYFCENGYNMAGENNIECRADGTWSSSGPTCSPVSCGPPPEINNAVARGTDFYYKKNITYECVEGYTMTGSNKTTCREDGSWTVPLLSCLPVSCGFPPLLLHSTPITTRQTYGGTTTYLCKEGYRIQGDPVATCSKIGVWLMDNETKCLAANCGIPPHIANASTIVTSTTYKSTVMYKCFPGFSILGNSVINCSSRGVWTGSLPTCMIDRCRPPALVNNVTIVSGSYGVGQSITFKCPEGHVAVGNLASTCMRDGTWSSAVPNCNRVVCRTLNISESGLVLRNPKFEYVYGDSVSFSCEDRYVMTGDSQILCTEVGVWNKKPPTCVSVDSLRTCPTDTGIANSLTLTDKYHHGERITVQCKSGFEAAGDLQIMCSESETWTYPSGYCRKKFCGKPRISDIVNVVRVQGNSYFYGDRVYFRCRPGIFPIKIPPIISCTETGQWDGEIACNVPCKGGCHNGGVCMGWRGCKCPPGYVGRRCEQANCILPCLHRGRCVAPYQCACPSEYTGSRCQTVICDPPCLHNGRCIQPNKCHCQHGFKGPTCAINIPDLRSLKRASRIKHTTTASPVTTVGGWLFSK